MAAAFQQRDGETTKPREEM